VDRLPERVRLVAARARTPQRGPRHEALREVSPLLGSRSGLSTTEDSMADIAAKVAELVDV
jgi:hypothetical protein